MAAVLRRPAIRCAGVSLAEMLVVAAIVGMVGVIAVPRADPANDAIVAATAAEVAHAIRFAQREAMRTGKYYSARIDPSKQTIRVYHLTGFGEVDEDRNDPVMHPVDKRAYTLTVGGTAATRATIVRSEFRYKNKNGTLTNDVTFDASGAPVHVDGSADDLDIEVLFDGQVKLQRGQTERVVRVDVATGRVTVETP
jgi:type II secretory pathway pseudopilin PulG